MKKLISIITCAALVAISATTSFALSNPIVVVNGHTLISDQSALIEDSRTLVPMRSIFESLGATVSWDQATMTVTGTKDDKTVILPIGASTIFINGISKPLDVPAKIINSRTMVPARVISESLGANVYWSKTAKVVTINQNDGAVHGVLAKVESVTDGDTITVNYNGVSEKVRLIGIDTPELVHPDESKNVPFGAVTHGFTKESLEGKEIELEFDTQERDQYGRLLAYVWIDGIMFNKTILAAGMAKVAAYPPNVLYVEDFTAIQSVAREQKIGIWEESALTSKPTVTNPSPLVTLIPNTSGIPATPYIGNSNTMKFHYPNCSSVSDMSISNMVPLETRDKAIRSGYIPCKRCNP